jgi:hypothetical protein
MSILWFGMDIHSVDSTGMEFCKKYLHLSMDCRDKFNATYSDPGQFPSWLGKCMFRRRECMASTPRSCCTTAICQRRQERHC